MLLTTYIIIFASYIEAYYTFQYYFYSSNFITCIQHAWKVVLCGTEELDCTQIGNKPCNKLCLELCIIWMIVCDGAIELNILNSLLLSCYYKLLHFAGNDNERDNLHLSKKLTNHQTITKRIMLPFIQITLYDKGSRLKLARVFL